MTFSGLSSLSSRAIIARIWQQLDQPAMDWASQIASPVFDSNMPTETYAGLGNVPPMTLWENGTQRALTKLRGITFQITNSPYQTGFEVNLDDVRRNKTGQVDQRISDLVQRYNEHWQKLVTALIVANGTSYDGVAFFSASHVELNSGTQTNLTAATGASPTIAQMEAGLLSGLATLYNLKDDQGEPINQGKKRFIAMVPVAMMNALYGALKLTAIAQSSGSQGSIISTLDGVEIMPAVNPRLSSASVGYLFAADQRAFIRQQETGPEISAKAEGSEFEYDYRAHSYGVATVRAAGLGSWQSATRITWS